MADEGGAAGAHMDSADQARNLVLVPYPSSRIRPIWLWGAVAAGAAAFAAGLFWQARVNARATWWSRLRNR